MQQKLIKPYNDSIYYRHPKSDLNDVMPEMLDTCPEESLCFLNEGKLREKVGILRDNFLPENEHRRILYSVKANAKNRIIKILSEEGIDGFDCSSPNEIDMALAQNPEAEIFFNNPIRTANAIKRALERDVRYFAVQSRRGIEKILQTAPQGAPEISVRLQTLNPEAKIDLSKKFGVTEETAKELLRFLKASNVRRGLSIHTGSQNTSPRAFEEGIGFMTGIARSEGGVNSVNLGGGIPVDYFEGGDFDFREYLELISRYVRNNIKGALDKASDPQIILELGRAIIAESVDLAIPVLATEKRLGKKCVYINDGVFTSFSDYPIHGWKYNLKTIGKNGRKLSETKEPYIVFGRTCDSGDTLGEADLPSDLKEGDHIWVPNAGAYMDTQASFFNGYEPPKYVAYNSGTNISSVTDNNDAQTGQAPSLSIGTEQRKQFKSEVLTPPELTEAKIKEIADFFRLIFNNDWPEFVVCPPCDSKLPDGMKMSASEVYGTKGETVPLEIMDTNPIIPDCPCCGEKMKIFHDPEKTYKNLSKKLGKDGYASLLRSKDDRIAGFAFGYGCTLEEEFWHEWGNKYHYMAEEDPRYNRDFGNFLQRLNEEFPDANFTSDSEIFCWNCVAASQEARGAKNSILLIQALFDSLPDEKQDLYIIGETLKGSNAHKIFRKLSGRDVEGVLEGDGTIIAGNVGRVTEGIKHFIKKSD